MRRGRFVKACLLCEPPKENEIEEIQSCGQGGQPCMFRKADVGDIDMTLNVDNFVQEDTLERDKTPPRGAIDPLKRMIRDAIAQASEEIKRAIQKRLERHSGFDKLLDQYNLVPRHL